jgi:hypothetical protein
MIKASYYVHSRSKKLVWNLAALVLVIICICMLLQGCCIMCCTKNERQYYVLTDDERLMVPYTDQQIIKFKNRDGEFDVTASVSEFQHDYTFHCGPECCDQLTNLQLRTFEFKAGDHKELFPIIVISPYSHLGDEGHIILYNKEDFQLLKTGEFGYNYNSLGYNSDYEISCFEICFMPVEIEGVTYDEVYKIPSGYQPTNFSFLYYFTRQHGLVKIEKNIYTSEAKEVLISTEEYFAVF